MKVPGLWEKPRITPALLKHLPQNYLLRHAIELFLKSGIIIVHRRFKIPFGTEDHDSSPIYLAARPQPHAPHGCRSWSSRCRLVLTSGWATSALRGHFRHPSGGPSAPPSTTEGKPFQTENCRLNLIALFPQLRKNFFYVHLCHRSVSRLPQSERSQYIANGVCREQSRE